MLRQAPHVGSLLSASGSPPPPAPQAVSFLRERPLCFLRPLAPDRCSAELCRTRPEAQPPAGVSPALPRGPRGQGFKPILALRQPTPCLPSPPIPSSLCSSHSRCPGFLPALSLLGCSPLCQEQLFLLPNPHLLGLSVSPEMPPQHEQRSEGRRCQASRLWTESWCGWTQSTWDTGRGIPVSGAGREVARLQRASVA